MDGSFLSDAGVVAASRRFVCVRLATYEDADEAEFLKTLFTGPTGALENTVFAILAPDGRTPLVRAGRSPDFAFPGGGAEAAAAMAKEMERIAAKHPAKEGADRDRPLPAHAGLRLALNVASCDLRPLVVAAGKDGEQAKDLGKRLAGPAWRAGILGRAEWVLSADAKERAVLGKEGAAPGILVVEPDAFGLEGKVVLRIPADATEERVAADLEKALGAFRPEAKKPREQIREARRRKIHWETAIPVTDPHAR